MLTTTPTAIAAAFDHWQAHRRTTPPFDDAGLNAWADQDQRLALAVMDAGAPASVEDFARLVAVCEASQFGCPELVQRLDAVTNDLLPAGSRLSDQLRRQALAF